jgi:hypothetical protein
MLNLGLFYWCGLGGLSKDAQEARRYWRLGGFNVPEFLLDGLNSIEPHSRSSVFTDPNIGEGDNEEDLGRNRTDRFGSVDIDNCFEFGQSFCLWSADQVQSIESLVMFDGHQLVRDFLLSPSRPSATDLGILTGQGIRSEGQRHLWSPRDSDSAEIMFRELIVCSNLRSLLELCIRLYTRETFLYRSVNKFMRESPNGDEETGWNLGLYIGLLRECFCISSGLSPLEWSIPTTLYRGADFPFEDVADYARRYSEYIWWQSFSSASADIREARKFRGNVLFQISVLERTASVSKYSAYPREQEFIIHPYQRFFLEGVSWDDSLNRWIIRAIGMSSLDPTTWLA